MKFFKGLTITVIAIASLMAAIFSADNLIPSPVRTALPTTATDIQEFHDFSGLQGDGIRLLKAKMPESEMPGFATRLGLSARYSPSKSKTTRVILSGSNSIAWWNPPADPTGAYFRDEPGKDKSEAVVYHNGYVY